MGETLEVPSTTVQQLIESTTLTQNVPQIYVSKYNVFVDLPYVDTPIIDFQLLLDLSSPLAQLELLKFRAALASFGCFQLVNHGVARSLMDQVHCVGKEFFALPAEEKQKYARTDNMPEGYGNDSVSQEQPINWNDRLHLSIYPIELRNHKHWPEIVPNFRETLDEYSMELKRALHVMLKAIAKTLDLEENIFGEDGHIFARFNYYPPCPNPDQVVGLRTHSDATLITIILQDKDVEGLQVRIDDQWYKVPIIPDALFVNVGDLLEILSNGILKSSVHKAVISKEAARMSVAVACCYGLGRKEIGPLSELIDMERPKLYKSVNNYIATYLESYARGESAIDAMKIPQ